MKERRALVRFELEVPAKVELESEVGKNVVLDLQTKNVSAAGAYFTSDAKVPEGVHVQIELFLNVEKLQKIIGSTSEVKVRLAGKVIRTESGGMAVAFNKKYEIATFSD